jgi:hypothetical protein
MDERVIRTKWSLKGKRCRITAIIPGSMIGAGVSAHRICHNKRRQIYSCKIANELILRRICKVRDHGNIRRWTFVVRHVQLEHSDDIYTVVLKVLCNCGGPEQAGFFTGIRHELNGFLRDITASHQFANGFGQCCNA